MHAVAFFKFLQTYLSRREFRYLAIVSVILIAGLGLGGIVALTYLGTHFNYSFNGI
jgi:hypothetical protein